MQGTESRFTLSRFDDFFMVNFPPTGQIQKKQTIKSQYQNKQANNDKPQPPKQQQHYQQQNQANKRARN